MGLASSILELDALPKQLARQKLVCGFRLQPSPAMLLIDCTGGHLVSREWELQLT